VAVVKQRISVHKPTHETGIFRDFLEMPVPVVLLSFWVLGAALTGGCVLALYYLFWVLLETLAGL
jgi:hypothetical protein